MSTFADDNLVLMSGSEKSVPQIFFRWCLYPNTITEIIFKSGDFNGNQNI